jgi:AcrR family transcriptional regulator
VATDTRERIVQTSAELFRRQGFAGTGVKQIVAEASAPFGSIYHFFPGGKEQLGAETIRFSGAIYGQLIDLFFQSGGDPVTSTRDFFAGAAQTLIETDYADACPIATVALEVSSTSEPMREACAEVFESWIEATSERLFEAGLTRKRAREHALTMLMSLEGVLARALRSTEPVKVAGAAATAAIRDALAARRKPGRSTSAGSARE